MNIRYFFCFKEDKRSSMEMLGNYISHGQKKYFKNKVSTYIPKTFFSKFIKQNNFIMRFERYISYPFQILFLSKSDISHVIDHSYSHLCRFINSSKKVVTINDLIPIIFENKLNRNSLLFKYSISKIKYFDHIVALSKQSKKDLVKYTKVNPSKISVVYPEVEACFNVKKVSKSVSIKKFKLPIDKKKIICFDTSFYKNFSYSYSIFKKILKFNNNIILIKIGNFSDNLIEEKYKKKIYSFDSLTRNEMSLLYKISDLLFFPSLYEGFGLPCLEAMKCGLPIITSKKGSLKEFVNKKSSFNLQERNKISNLILKILTKKKYQNKFRSISLKQSKKLNLIPYHDQINKIYKKLLN